MCYLCAKTGHPQFDCPELPPTAIKCFGCRGLGHLEANCRSRRNPRGGRWNRAEKQREIDASKEESAALATSRARVRTRRPVDGVRGGDQGEEDLGCPPGCPFVASPHRACPPWSQGPPTWVLDSGTTRSLATSASLLKDIKQTKPVKMRTAGGHVMSLDQAGSATLPCDVKQGASLTVKNVLYSPKVATNLLSVAALVDSGAEVTFRAKDAIVKSVPSGEIIATIPRVGNLWTWPSTASKANKKKDDTLSKEHTAGGVHQHAGHGEGGHSSGRGDSRRSAAPAPCACACAAAPALASAAVAVAAPVAAPLSLPSCFRRATYLSVRHRSRGLQSS